MTVRIYPAWLIGAALLVMAPCDFTAAEPIPVPPPRPAPAAAGAPVEGPKAEVVQPSACRLRLTAELAVAPSLPAIEGPGECGAPDLVRLEAVVLPDKSRVAVTPAATLRCTTAEAIVSWLREEAAPLARDLGAALHAVQNFDSYDCRGRNRVAGAKISEHGKGNALDIRALKLADGKAVELTDPHASRDFREKMRQSMCARFTTVLGPGSDGFHENHVHVDLAERRGGYRMCQWELRNPDATPAAEAAVPLPPAKPRLATPNASAPRRKL